MSMRIVVSGITTNHQRLRSFVLRLGELRSRAGFVGFARRGV